MKAKMQAAWPAPALLLPSELPLSEFTCRALIAGRCRFSLHSTWPTCYWRWISKARWVSTSHNFSPTRTTSARISFMKLSLYRFSCLMFSLNMKQ